MRGRIGPYRIETTLEQEGMGIVYKGFHDGLKRQAAIRVLSSAFGADPADPKVRERLRLEVEAQARLQHPNTEAVYELLDDHGELFLVTEYLEGPTLDFLLKKNSEIGRRFPLSEALDFFQQITAALDYVHQNGIVHRGVKPSSIILANGQPKLLNFGIAALSDLARQTSPWAVSGTPAYVSPEQLRAQEVDSRSDIYSAAAVLFEMLAGRPLFPGKNDFELLRCHTEELPPQLKTLVPELPAGISDAVAIALQKDPKLRFQSVGDFLRALQEGAVGFLPVPPDQASEAPAEMVTTSAEIPLSYSAPADLHPPQRPRLLWHPATAWVLLALGVVSTFGLWKAWYRPQPLPRIDVPGASTPARPAPPPEPSPFTTPPPEEKPLKETVSNVAPVSPPKKLPPPEATPEITPVIVQPEPEEFRRREIDRLREEVRSGLEAAQADFETQDFDSTQEKLDLLIGMTQQYPAELQPESAEIRSLRKRVTEAQVAQQTKQKEQELQQAAWETRLQQIQTLIAQGSFPEAEKLARDLSEEQGLPESVSARARQLRSQAKDEIVKAFKDTEFGPTKNDLRKPPG